MTHISEFDWNDGEEAGPKASHGRVFIAPAGTEFMDAEWTEVGYATLDNVLDFEGGEDLDWQPPFTSWATAFPIDPESDSLAILMGKPTRAELEQQIEDMKREVQFWKQMVDDVAEDYERELEKAQRLYRAIYPSVDFAWECQDELRTKKKWRELASQVEFIE